MKPANQDKTSVLVVPDGTGIRNFFCTRFIDLMLEAGPVVVWHGLPKDHIVEFEQHWGSAVQWQPLPAIQDAPWERLLRHAKLYAQLYWQQKWGSKIYLKRRPPSPHWKTRLLAQLAKGMGHGCATPHRIVWLDTLHQAAAARSQHMPAYLAQLRQMQPKMVFGCHQRALAAVPALIAARQLQVPNATFIYSWDNVPKGRMAVRADHYLVWSQHMRDEMRQFYPDIAPERIQVVGTPQFEPYFDSSLLQPRDLFLSELKLDPGRPVLCFSGDDLLTSPYDQEYLADLARILRTLPARGRPQILFRRSPVDWSKRYDRVLAEFPEIAVSNPLWRRQEKGDWSEIVPTRADTALLVNVVRHADLVINVGSTMVMDFAVYNKPGIFIAYNPTLNGACWNFQAIYDLPHFQSVHETQPVYWARSPQDLGTLVQNALCCPEEKASARQAWLRRIVQHPLDQSSQRFATTLIQLAL